MRIIHNKDPDRNVEFNLEGCELIVAGKTLIEDTKIHLAQGHRYALIGRNGVGKT